VASTLSSLGNLYSRMGRYGDAERLLKRVVQIYQGAADGGGNLLNYSANASETLAQNQLALAQVLYKGGNSNEAESMFKAYVETVRKDKGPSVDLANALKHVAVFYKSQNRSSEADA
ncbi:tetratricopeptide repeat protein, partial [Pseudomonas sp. Bc-h]|uniref:tetratricopeptide repeat protein n=1 Tax=Pseudomonas sp. Bc-h TaxID=1943632 RepID=UPI001179F0D2